MPKSSRTYKLKVSPSGFDLIVDSHDRIVRATRTLLPYGAALHAALHLFEALEPDDQIAIYLDFPLYTLSGGRSGNVHFVGGSVEIATIAERLIIDIAGRLSEPTKPTKNALYLMSLSAMLRAANDSILSSYKRAMMDSPGHD